MTSFKVWLRNGAGRADNQLVPFPFTFCPSETVGNYATPEQAAMPVYCAKLVASRWDATNRVLTPAHWVALYENGSETGPHASIEAAMHLK